MSFVVLRCAKLKTAANIGGLNAHLTRTMDVPNADPELQKYNSRPIGTTDLNKDIQDRIKALGITPRTNAVLAVENLITSGAEAFGFHKREDGLYGNMKRWDAFERNALEWLEERYGKENLVNFTVHNDENAPHIHAIIVPITEGKLNCRKLLGNRDKLREMQTSIAKKMEGLGLERGIEGSKATHTTLKEFYGNLQKGESLAIEAREQLDKLLKTELIGKIPVLGHAKWKEEQEANIKKMIKEVVNKYEPMVKISIQVKQENRKLQEQVKKLSKENSQLKGWNDNILHDIRSILIERRISPGMEQNYIRDVLQKREAEKEIKVERSRDRDKGMFR